MNLAKSILALAGWKVDITVPDYPKAIVCVAPHTSNWDFVLGKLAYASVHRKAGFLMKASWFRWPLGYIFRAIGGIPVERRNKSVSLTQAVIEKFDNSERLTVAITPEGTRSRTTHWHTGFLRIAIGAKIPIVLGAIDAATRTILIRDTFSYTDDIDDDIRRIKAYYSQFTALKPSHFSTDPDDATE